MTNRHSRAACCFTIEALPGPESIMWTFTFTDVHPVAEAVVRWSECARLLVRELGFYGVRGFELHPGGHGLHIHVATSARYRVEEVMAIARRFGFGRIDVRWKTRDRLKYVGKEVTKRLRERGWSKGRRIWSSFGEAVGWVKTKVMDVRLENAWTDASKALYAQGWRRLGLLRQTFRTVMCAAMDLDVYEYLCRRGEFLHGPVFAQLQVCDPKEAKRILRMT